MIKTGFSFTYLGERRTFCESGTYKIDENLSVTCVRRDYDKYNASDWVIYFENVGNENTSVISDINDCDTVITLNKCGELKRGFLPEDGFPALIWQNGCVGGGLYNFDDMASAEEYKMHRQYFSHTSKSFHLQNLTGRSSDGTFPFFNLESKDCGAMIAIGWTGGWKADFEYDFCGNVSVKTGLQCKTNFYLEPGEKVRTSSVLIMKYSGIDSIDPDNKFRRLIKEHYSHKGCTESSRDGLFAYELWGGLPSEEMIKRLGKLKEHGIRFEDLWIDAGWYGQCTDCDSPYTGDWYKFAGEWEINKRVHPQHLEDVKKAAKDAGMKMMLWFEPERATGHVPIIKEHPEYFISKGNGDFIVNYGNAKAREYIFEVLSRYIEELEMSCYRQDFNTDLNVLFASCDAEDRKGITEIKHICGMYRLWDDLQKRFPGLLIDNCSSGGRRFDIETIKRSVAFFRSDYQCGFNANAEVLQAHNSGISIRLPYNGCTTKVKNDTYNARSSYSASWGCACYNAVFQEMSDEDFKWLKGACDEYLRIRKYYSCDFYNHGSKIYDTSAWTIWQYNDEETESGIVLAFRRSESPFDRVKIPLKGIRKGDTVEVENLNDGTKRRISAGDISGDLEIVLEERRSSVVYEYKVVK